MSHKHTVEEKSSYIYNSKNFIFVLTIKQITCLLQILFSQESNNCPILLFYKKNKYIIYLCLLPCVYFHY